MKAEYLSDIIFGILVLPGMMFLFPVGEWAQWHPGYVLTYAAWLYGILALARYVLGPLLLQGRKGLATVGGALFLVAAVTFLMSLTPVEIPRSVESGILGHVRAMWILLLAVIAYGLPVGMLSVRLRETDAVRAKNDALDAAQSALETRRTEALAGQEIQLTSDYRKVHVPLSAVRYIEARNNYACFHLDHRDDIVTQMTMKAVMALLPEGKFARIHRSYIVPLWRITSRTASSVKLMDVPDPLPVGRAYKDQLS